MGCAAYFVNAYLLAFEILHRGYITVRSYRKFYTAFVQSVHDLDVYTILDRREKLKVTVHDGDSPVVEPYLPGLKICGDKIHIKAFLGKITVLICHIDRRSAQCAVLAGNIYAAIFKIICFFCLCLGSDLCVTTAILYLVYRT